MTAVYMDGFDHYGTGDTGLGNMLDGPWAQASSGLGPTIPPFGPRTGTTSLGAPQGSNYRKVLPATLGNMFMSLGFAVDGLPRLNFSNPVVSFATASNSIIATLWCQADGSLALANSSNTVLAQTQGPVIVSRNWHFLEMNFNQAGGGFVLRVDDADATGTPAINATGLSLGSSPVGQLQFVNSVPGPNAVTAYMDDLFIRNTSGSVNNTWLGDRRVATLFANADTATAGWSPSYYKHFGTGIATLGHIVPNNSTPLNNQAVIATAGATALDIGSSDFTLETWVRFDVLPTGSNFSSIFSRWNTSSTTGRSFRLLLGSQSFNGGCLQFDTSTDGTGGTVVTKILYPWTPLTNVWYHVALCRSAGQLLLFVNGQQFGLPISDSNTYFTSSPSAMSIGGQVDSSSAASSATAGTNIAGRLDETRFTNGVGRYTATFTPPSGPFPRGSGSDPDWSSVVWLMGYDSGVLDESGFSRAVSANSGAVSFLPADGPTVGVYSTVNKVTPDDNTFIQAAFTNATNILTMTSQPSNNTTVTVGTKDGTTAAVYTFKTAISTAYDVLIDTTATNTLTNLLNAINAGSGAGTKYGTGTVSNFDVTASALPAGQILVTANIAGSGGNSIASTSTSTGSWATSTLIGGANIPGPSAFKVQRPPNNTTVISALQMNVRALKTDSGTGTIQSTFVGPLGGTAAGSTHALTVNANYYQDILESDPDTSGPLTPTTIVNGEMSLNRTA